MITADYEVVVDGELPAAFAPQFAPATVQIVDGCTILFARDLDQAALHGLLARVADLGLTLLEIRRPTHH